MDELITLDIKVRKSNLKVNFIHFNICAGADQRVEMEKTMNKKCLYLAVLLLLWAVQPVFSAAEKSLPDLKKEVIRIIDRESTLLIETSDAIWEFAETALLEFKSSKLLADILEKKGFSVKREVADLSTALEAPGMVAAIISLEPEAWAQLLLSRRLWNPIKL